MLDQLKQALLDLKEKRIIAKEADAAKKAYINSEKGIALAKAKKDADELSKTAKQAVYDLAVEMVKAKIDLEYGVKKTNTSEKVSFKYSVEDATAWCLENYKAAVTANCSMFESMLENMEVLPEFVEKVVVPAGFDIRIPSKIDIGED